MWYQILHSRDLFALSVLSSMCGCMYEPERTAEHYSIMVRSRTAASKTGRKNRINPLARAIVLTRLARPPPKSRRALAPALGALAIWRMHKLRRDLKRRLWVWRKSFFWYSAMYKTRTTGRSTWFASFWVLVSSTAWCSWCWTRAGGATMVASMTFSILLCNDCWVAIWCFCRSRCEANPATPST